MKIPAALVALSLSTLWATPAVHAAPRPPTETEKAFCSKVLTTCASALPPAPKGWKETRAPSTEAPASLEGDATPIALSLEASWRDPKSPQAPPKEVPKAEPTPEEKLLRRQDELAKALSKASEKGDEAESERIVKELDDIEAQLDKLAEESPAPPPTPSPLTAKVPDDALTVRIEVNPTVQRFPEGTRPLEAVAGLKAYRIDRAPGGESAMGTTTVLLGTWSQKEASSGLHLSADLPGGAPATSVQTLAVHVDAVGSRALKTVEAVDWKALKGLLTAPPPKEKSAK